MNLRWRGRHGLRSVIVTGLVGAAGLNPALGAQTNVSEWPVVGGQLDAQRYSPLSEINLETIARLGGAWISQPFENGASSRVTPIVTQGRMYLSAGVHVYCLDAGTGQLQWKRALGSAEDAPSAANAFSFFYSHNPLPNGQGLAAGQGMVFAGTASGTIVALKQSDGTIMWSKDLRDGRQPLQNVSAAPVFADGSVFTSLSKVERGVGTVFSLDARTGRERWRFEVVPRGAAEPDGQTWPSDPDTRANGGGNVWLPPAVDLDLGLVYFGTGNPAPIKAGEHRAGANLYTSSVIALDIKTGKLRWHYQMVHHDLWEMDVATPLVVYRSRSGRVIAAMRPDGILFRLNAATGEPISAIEERAVAQENAEATWPTQPYPVGTESILPPCEEYRGRVPAGFELKCDFFPPSNQQLNVLAPSSGVRLNPMSYSPQTGYLYAQGNAGLEWRRRSADPYAYDAFGYDARVPGIDSARSRVFAAIDVSTGKVAWRQTQKGPGLASGGAGLAGGGFLATGGGLLFRRDGEGRFLVLEAASGRLIWSYRTGGMGGSGSPISYRAGRKQYVAVVDNNVVRAFSLDGAIAAQPPSEDPPPLLAAEPFAGPIKDAQMVELASLHQENPFQAGTRYEVDEYAPEPYRARFEGLTVVFANTGKLTHTLAAVDGSWKTRPIRPGQTASFTFMAPGTYAYHCLEHPFSYGEVIVGDVGHTDQTAGLKGEDVYSRHCASCHGINLAGGAHGAAALTGKSFVSSWQTKGVDALFERIRTSMPATAPGSLTDADYWSVTRYLLSANELEPR